MLLLYLAQQKKVVLANLESRELETKNAVVHLLEDYTISVIKANKNNPPTEEDKELKRLLLVVRAYVGHTYVARRRIFHFTK